ncbi:flagellar basal body L-ring protein FlgH [Pseudoroseomonas cervicalis]|uniref:flagellar basal body L-ring protein FlgH n=1 Tax=Teichococcus cervicalis TaxID=204525 RepID=UPI0022F16413|nr:flagellar basal body L-ring protein FlgH [Pseudoroseomonas cervicalis]WBV44571.1 flagellar basal body L-ring protein FlgH [Pseudoroseomonas cervicalis]
MHARPLTSRAAPLGLLLLALAGCGNIERISEIGRGPQLAPIENPAQVAGLERSIAMPMPPTQQPLPETNSLWRPGSRTFLRDQRAAQVGDLVTVLVQITDKAELENTTGRSRTNNEDFGITRLLGMAARLPGGAGNLLETASKSGTEGTGSINRNETVTLRVAATVVQMLPNGNLVVAGRQQVRVNQELRELQVSGIIRSQDIASDNTVRHDRLAEARIAYGGRGIISDVQQPRYGQQFLDLVLPF